MCVYCGKSYGKRFRVVTTEQFAIGTPLPEYNGAGFVLHDYIRVGAYSGPDYKEPGATLIRSTWDGVSYVSHYDTDPFCNPECGARFGKMAYDAGYRMPEA